MDEKTIERSLRQGRPSEPGYRPRLDAVAVGRVFAQEDGPSVHQQTTPQLARFLTMNSMLKVVGVAVLALAVGVTILPRGPDIGAAPAPSASPSPTPSAVPFGEPGALAPGMYTGPLGTGRWTVTVPEGWEWFYSILWKDLDGVSDDMDLGGPGEVAFIWWPVENVFADPCQWKDSLADPPVGPTVDDLATAFVAQVGRDGTGPTDVMLGGYPAKRIELSVPADLDVTTCDEGVYREFLEPGEALALPEGFETPDIAGMISVYYILDVEGTRHMMRTWHRPDASEQDLAELEAMLASIVIEPPAPSPAASSPTPPEAASAVRGWPGARADRNTPGLYSWTMESLGWMHKIRCASGSEWGSGPCQADPSYGPVEFLIGKLDDPDTDRFPVDMRPAAIDFDGPHSDVPSRVSDVRGADGRKQLWYVDGGEARIFILVQSYPDTDPADVAEAEAIVESIRVEPTVAGTGYRFVFSLPGGWDSG